MKFDSQKHHRRSIRLQEYDYAQAGGYFVTIVTYQRDLLFGEIVDEEMMLNDFGKIADECWRAIPEHFPNVELGAYVVMPNHVHGIITITDGRGTIYRAPTIGNRDYPMHMIWHDHIRTQLHVGKMFGNGTPTFVRDFAEIVQHHFLVHNFPEQQIALIRHDRDKISAGLGVVIFLQTDRTTMMLL